MCMSIGIYHHLNDPMRRLPVSIQEQWETKDLFDQSLGGFGEDGVTMAEKFPR
jgi:hypothetical protein